MNRTTEFLDLIEIEKEKEYIPPKQDKFFDSLKNKLTKLEENLKENNKYVDVLVIEEKFLKTLKETQQIFKIIDLESHTDEGKHFQGVVAILNLKLNALEKKIQAAKKETMTLRIDLEPELARVDNFHKNTNTFTSKNKQKFMEHENQELVRRFVDTNLQETRNKVMEIQSIQDLIGMHIEAHDERIDNVQIDTKITRGNVKNSIVYIKKNNGSYFRRLLFLFLLCMSFILIFLHFFYR